jgi:hypothetical protein
MQVQQLGLRDLLARHCSFPGIKNLLKLSIYFILGVRDFVLYGDSGFALARQIITPFRYLQSFH